MVEAMNDGATTEQLCQRHRVISFLPADSCSRGAQCAAAVRRPGGGDVIVHRRSMRVFVAHILFTTFIYLFISLRIPLPHCHSPPPSAPLLRSGGLGHLRDATDARGRRTSPARSYNRGAEQKPRSSGPEGSMSSQGITPAAAGEGAGRGAVQPCGKRWAPREREKNTL